MKLEVKEMFLAPALSPKGVCSLMVLNHGTVFSRVPSCQSVLLCVHFGITGAHFCSFSFFVKIVETQQGESNANGS